MVLQEASRRFALRLDLLLAYEENGLLKGQAGENGAVDYPGSELRRACEFQFLTKAGMDMDALKRYCALSEKGAAAKEERLRLLRQCRCRLLGEIHEKQQLLDHLDYLLYELKNQTE